MLKYFSTYLLMQDQIDQKPPLETLSLTDWIFPQDISHFIKSCNLHKTHTTNISLAVLVVSFWHITVLSGACSKWATRHITE